MGRSLVDLGSLCRAGNAVLVLAALTPGPVHAAGAGNCPPPTRKEPVVDTYHGVRVTDDYRWLENGSDPKVKGWSDAQNTCARAYLDKLSGRDLIKKRLMTLEGGASPMYYDLRAVKGSLFAMKEQPPKQQPFLVIMRSPNDAASARVILDTNVLDSRGITAIDWYEPSPDGKLVAVSLSVGGTEDGTLHVYETATGKQVYETIARVQEGTGGGHVAWDTKGTGLFYTRYPRGTERPKEDLDFFQQVYHHTLGTPVEKDAYAIGKDWPRIAETTFKRSDDGAWILARVANGDGGEFAFFLLGPSGTWTRVADFKDGVKSAEFAPGNSLVMRSVKDAPRGQVLRLSLATPDIAKATMLVPQSDAVIEQALPTATRLFVNEMVGGPSRVRVFDLNGKNASTLPIQPVTTVWGMVRSGPSDVLIGQESFVSPSAWHLYAASTGKIAKTSMARTSPADFSDTQVVQMTGTSKDGTKVPLTLLMLKDVKPNGDLPTLLTGYGGFGISQSPFFWASAHLWIEQGGVIAIASMRGGGEFGEEWHAAGKLTHKQNVFDDFAACAHALIDAKYTRSAHLAIEGGSNGGLLMGAELTQHPDLFKVVVSSVGIYDMLRVELSTNGMFNTTEFGSVKDPEQFKALYAYSPYHHVKSGTPYPPVLFITGANDPRVDPMQSRKMTARLQAANSSKNPVLLRTSSSSGHGVDMAFSERIDRGTDEWSFIFNGLGVEVRPVGKMASR